MISADPRASWHNPRVLFVLLLVFLSGSLAGAVAMRYAFHPAPPQPAAYWTQSGKEFTLQHFVSELDLNPQQAAEIAAILDDFMVYYHTLQAQMDEVRGNGKGRILSVLNPEQQQKFRRMLQDVPVGQIH